MVEALQTPSFPRRMGSIAIRVIKWIIPLLLVLFVLSFLLRDQLMITLMKWEQAERQNRTVEKIPLPTVSTHLQEQMAQHLKLYGRSPTDYILAKFTGHDIVFLGEYHRIRQDVEFVQRVIPLLPTVGVHTLGFEFACHRDQPLLDELLTKPDFDEDLARAILFKLSPAWGYQEYLDVFRAGWGVNQNRSPNDPPFQIIALSRIMDWSHVKTEADRDNKEIMGRVFPEGDGDAVMARIVMDKIVNKNRRALIYCGIHHAFTRFKQPILVEEKQDVAGFCSTRLGNRVFTQLGSRTCTIFLHSPWINRTGYRSRMVYPADGFIDAFIQTVETDWKSFGIDTARSAFGALPAETSLYSLGQEHFQLADFCDGYIYLQPLSEIKSVQWIPDFINSENMAETREQLPNPRLKSGILSWMGPTALNYLFASDADLELRFRHLH